MFVPPPLDFVFFSYHPLPPFISTAPTVIFFDEIDALAGRRGSGDDSKASERVLSQLLTGR